VPYLIHRRRRPASVKDLQIGLAPAQGGALVLFGWQR